MVLTFEQSQEKDKCKHTHKKELDELKDLYSEKLHTRNMAELNIKLKIAKLEFQKQLEFTKNLAH
ncbi:unnamed protein product [marine sediment metagenome]|uniref:Uncharacterized protein n=1 Tax=marine sediment metagenome TaxID=412755 RepID=X1QBW7_9ZZZZ